MKRGTPEIGRGHVGHRHLTWLLAMVGGAVALVASFLVFSLASGARPGQGAVFVQATPSLVSFHGPADKGDEGGGGNDDEGGHFTISGNALRVLYPGRRSRIDLAFTNPTGHPITVPGTAITITITSPRTACPVTPNFSLVRTLTSAITIPKGATGTTLSDLGVTGKAWPVVEMVTTHTTQDACAGMTLTLHYSFAGGGGDHD